MLQFKYDVDLYEKAKYKVAAIKRLLEKPYFIKLS